MSDTDTIENLPTLPLPPTHPLAGRPDEFARQMSPTFTEAQGHIIRASNGKPLGLSAIRQRHYRGEYPNAWNDDGTIRVPWTDFAAVDGWEVKQSLTAEDEDRLRDDTPPATTVVVPPTPEAADASPSTPPAVSRPEATPKPVVSATIEGWVSQSEYDARVRELAEARELLTRVASERDRVQAIADERAQALDRADRSFRVLELTAGAPQVPRPARPSLWQRLTGGQ